MSTIARLKIVGHLNNRKVMEIENRRLRASKGDRKARGGRGRGDGHRVGLG